MKNILWITVLASFIIGTYAAMVSAQDGDPRKGKYTFRKSCRTCHSDKGTAPPLSPDSKTQAQWARVFEPEKYQKLACKDEWGKLSEKELADVFSYLHKYAFDSPSPAKCK